MMQRAPKPTSPRLRRTAPLHTRLMLGLRGGARPASKSRTRVQCLSRPRSPHAAPRRQYLRPSIAPKAVLDIRSITKSPGLYEQNCIDRNYKSQSRNSWTILELSQKRTALQQSARKQREQNNAVQRQIKELQRGSVADGSAAPERREKEAALTSLLAQAKGLKEDIASFAAQERRMDEEILELALALPNLSSHETPNGDAFEIVEVVEPAEDNLKYHSNRPERCVNSGSKSHVDIGSELDLLDFAGSAKTSGWGWYSLKNEAALLEQALVQYALSVLRDKGFTIVAPPSIVYSHIAAACGFQPRDQNGEQQIYTLQQPDKDANKPALSLAATAEIPLAGMYADHTFAAADLPLRTAAVSRCYRAEAGARGVDTKGLYRVHEFTKVEMFAWTVPPPSGGDGYFETNGDEGSVGIFDEMVDIQKKILTSLGLTFRVLEMPATDLGGPASRKRDIEVYFPSRKDKDEGWGEVTSTSMCTDYQSRRLGSRVKIKSEDRLDWPHTLNGTAMAVPRVLAAILETHYDAGRKSVSVPHVLRRWMDMDEIKR